MPSTPPRADAGGARLQSRVFVDASEDRATGVARPQQVFHTTSHGFVASGDYTSLARSRPATPRPAPEWAGSPGSDDTPRPIYSPSFFTEGGVFFWLTCQSHNSSSRPGMAISVVAIQNSTQPICAASQPPPADMVVRPNAISEVSSAYCVPAMPAVHRLDR